jgi:hypothetical protein
MPLPEEQKRFLAAADPGDLEPPALQALDQGFDKSGSSSTTKTMGPACTGAI